MREKGDGRMREREVGKYGRRENEGKEKGRMAKREKAE